MESKVYNFWCYFIIISLRNILTQYSYPPLKSISRYSVSTFRDKKVNGSTQVEEAHASYNQCIAACYKKGLECKSIDAEILNNGSMKCRFFNIDYPSIKFAEGIRFISIRPPNCSHSCSLTLNPCGRCKCNPSCSGKNRRQLICDCKEAAGVEKNCQKHYNNGFSKTGIYQISPNGSAFAVLCEMEKLERQNPRATNPICASLKPQLSFNVSVSYCVVFCAMQSGVNTMFYSPNQGCHCGLVINGGSGETQWSYCHINLLSKNCVLTFPTLTNSYIRFNNKIDIGYITWSSCVNFCVDYQHKNPNENGYKASFIADVNGDCQCLYGFSGQTTPYKLSCSFDELISPTVLPNITGVWIPMMTRFAKWESSFWNRSYEAYENGFGLVNQQWIGLKKIYQITNTFLTDMRVDYLLENSITFSTMYNNVTISSSNNNYMFSYEKYDHRRSFEPDRFNANGMTFKNCSKWWTHDCDMSPTLSNNILYGSTEKLVSIQFLLRTNDRKWKIMK